MVHATVGIRAWFFGPRMDCQVEVRGVIPRVRGVIPSRRLSSSARSAADRVLASTTDRVGWHGFAWSRVRGVIPSRRLSSAAGSAADRVLHRRRSARDGTGFAGRGAGRDLAAPALIAGRIGGGSTVLVGDGPPGTARLRLVECAGVAWSAARSAAGSAADRVLASATDRVGRHGFAWSRVRRDRRSGFGVGTISCWSSRSHRRRAAWPGFAWSRCGRRGSAARSAADRPSSSATARALGHRVRRSRPVPNLPPPA